MNEQTSRAKGAAPKGRKTLSKLLIITVAVGLAACSRTNISSPSSTSVVDVTTAPSATASSTPAASATPNTPVVPVKTGDDMSHAFGISDLQGSRILIISPDDDPPEESDDAITGINRAIGDKGHVLTVRFQGTQSRDDKSSGRDVSDNFAHLAGYVYQVVDGKAKPDETYYLVNDINLNPNALLPLQTPDSAAAPTTDATILALKSTDGREVKTAWLLGQIGDGKELYLVRYADKGDQLLAALVFRTGDRISDVEYPAKLQGSTAWRVDDGGELTPAMFTFLLAAQSDKGTLIGLNWLGAEGVNSFFLEDTGELELQKLDIESNRYTQVN